MRYVVISIEDNNVADKFTEDILNSLQMGYPFVPRGAQIVGSFAVPTKFCDPTDGHRGKKTEAGWTRGKKYGWWVCGACKKPTEAWGTNLNSLLSSCRNLLNDGREILGAAQVHQASEGSDPSGKLD
jgi:hypothetical protein